MSSFFNNICSNFFNSFTENGFEYVAQITSTQSEACKEKLTNIIEKHSISLNNFPETIINLSIFDWHTLDEDKDRNWWWQLQSLPILSNYIGGYDLLTKAEQDKYFGFCLNTLINWAEKTREHPSPLAWHDHATAFRLMNIVNWLFLCLRSGYKDYLVIYGDFFEDIINKHLFWLFDHKNYSQFTNHGFDQSMISYLVCLMIDKVEYKEVKICSRERLKQEIDYSFTVDGVHKENSPGYQKFMLGRLKGLINLQVFNDHDLYRYTLELIAKAESFLEAITLPNGFLPMVGDTQGDNLGICKEDYTGIKVLNYSQSGYFIVKGKLVDGKNIFILLKNSHLSNYHRHDDDCFIYFLYDDQVIFSDAGLYSHNEESIDRVFVRSAYAHSVPLIKGREAIRDINTLEHFPTMEYDSHLNIITMCTFCYGHKLTREIDISGLNDFKISIFDYTDSLDDKIVQNFYFSEGEQEKDKSGKYLTSRSFANISIDLLCDVEPEEISIEDGIISHSYKTKLGAQSLRLHHASNRAKCIVDFNAKKEKEIYSIKYRGQETVTIYKQNNWFYDDVISNNYNHHILSLRWLSDIKDISIIETVLKDFNNYHNKDETLKSRYYCGAVADHTTAIRLHALDNIKERYIAGGRIIPIELELEITKNMQFITEGISYKPNNNHGLSCDLAILTYATKEYNEVDFSVIKLAIKRCLLQLEGIFFPSGECKEHSISYQEYNLQLLKTATEIIGCLNKKYPNKFDNDFVKTETLFLNSKEMTKVICGLALQKNKTYFQAGDSFRIPNAKILADVYQTADPLEAFMPYSQQNSFMISKRAGFSSFRNELYHFYFTASWHSYVHKQNDDLSFSLLYKGEDLFLDGGYSDIIAKSTFDSASEKYHSLPTVVGHAWGGRNKLGVNDFSGIKKIIRSENINGVFGESSRISGVSLNRALFVEETRLHILDCCLESDKKLEISFLLPKKYVIEIDEAIQAVMLMDTDGMVLMMKNKYQGRWALSESSYLVERNQLGECNRLVFHVDGNISSLCLTADSFRFYDLIIENDYCEIVGETEKIVLGDVDSTVIYEIEN